MLQFEELKRELEEQEEALEDLGQALGFNVGWSAEKGVYIETK